MSNRARLRAAFAGAAIALLAITGAASASPDRNFDDDIDATKAPVIKRIGYFDGDATLQLEAIVLEADSVAVTVAYGGETARASAWPERGHGERREWRLRRGVDDNTGSGTRGLLRLTQRAFEEVGAFTVKFVAENEAGRTKVKVPIVLAECSQNPPLYPFSCDVKP